MKPKHIKQPKKEKRQLFFSIIIMVNIVIISGNHTETGTSNRYVSSFENENPNEKI